jgi:hypothetical protein
MVGSHEFSCRWPQRYEIGFSVEQNALVSSFDKSVEKNEYVANLSFEYEIYADGEIVERRRVEKPMIKTYSNVSLDFYDSLIYSNFKVPRCSQARMVISDVKGGFGLGGNVRFELYIAVMPFR